MGVTAGVTCGVRLKSSMARPSSLPVGLTLTQRSQKVAPCGMLRPWMVEPMAVRLAAALPSSAPAEAAVLTGLTKSSASKSV
jgi:hypothetical protein